MVSRLFRRRLTVLLAWESGGGQGHVNRLLAFADCLRAADVRFVFALRYRAGEDVVRARFPRAAIVESPCHVSIAVGDGRIRPLASSYVDILHRCGFDSAENLGSLVRGWEWMFDAYRPTLIVADHSPSLVFANRARIPLVNVGTGFTTPPPGQPFMTLFPGTSSGAHERERDVLISMQRVRHDVGGTSVDRVCDLWLGTQTIACTWPELDPYRNVRGFPAAGPMEECPARQPTSDGGVIFAYLAGEDPRITSWLNSLVKAGIRGSMYIRNCPTECANQLAGSPLRLHDRPVEISTALREASLVLHHGGSLANAALAAGRPQVIVPRNLDQWLVGRSIGELTCGALCMEDTKVGEAVSHVMGNANIVDFAGTLAHLLAERPRIPPAQQFSAFAQAVLGAP